MSKKSETPTLDAIITGVTHNVTNNVTGIVRRENEDNKKQGMELQTELVYKMEQIMERLNVIEKLLNGKQNKVRAERKLAPKAAAEKPAAEAPAAGEKIKIPATWAQFLSFKFETDNDYYEKMLSNDEHRKVAEGVAGLDKIKPEEMRRRKQGTALAGWIKKNDADLVKTIQAEHRAFKEAANKPEPAVQQKAEPDSDDE